MKRFCVIYQDEVLDTIIIAENEQEAYEKAMSLMIGPYDGHELYVEEEE